MRHAAGLLAGARRLVVFTGAGVSAESGIPTFRDALDGLWARYDPAALATPAAFADDPALVWGWYEWRRQKVLRAQPNPAHRAIAALADRVADTRLVTQNVDDLHERAGSREVLHLHGSLHAPRCAGCAMAYRGPLAEAAEPEAGRRIEPPRCRACGGPVRPGVVWFGEALPETALREAFAAAGECDLLLSVGTSGMVQPAARIPALALERGASVVHVNPQPVRTGHPRERCLVGTAGEVLPALLRLAFPG
ncbi:NAD-dependent deacylase [Pseudomonas aeruginosa]|uniref:NAD-dependent protein deacylase n=1 Tax=Pseudomonas paraeruginosa (strain DSM 24068 / PA7) TaxID=381754 RepID=A6V963_PSEP7|nr:MULTISPECIES: NAD-dependent deacylase [Pseudomonas aeruginosa group]ABR84432.1 putative cobalamin biosynthetic protein [Pseudomonas aeruginosa PA7]KSC78203.1 NAD-dependent deacylase [Pseudomonas aeruginosa]KSD08406.1 NAD-dependent deacylase [Pseudomonas aeruginosa]KSG60978.1 NAD-dependent deacylase [Pseudomonas aeruginosa]MCW8360770.1 NAD-dependent deacylase [Pseudomonas aeruginosa]